MNDIVLNEDDLSLILSYMLIYSDLLEAEGSYIQIKTYGNKLKYLKAHEAYESALGSLILEMNPIDVILTLRKIKELCNQVEQNISDEFNLQSSEESPD